MKDISNLIQFWIVCCNDVWKRWFLDRNHGAHEFVEIEEKLLEVLVAGQLNRKGKTFPAKEFIKRIRVQYTVEVNGSRQVCVRQTAGNIFGRAENVTISKDSYHAVQGIDTMGTMLHSMPYAEVEWKKGFILEPVQNLKFLLTDASE